jgi:hypothetical protein
MLTLHVPHVPEDICAWLIGSRVVLAIWVPPKDPRDDLTGLVHDRQCAADYERNRDKDRDSWSIHCSLPHAAPKSAIVNARDRR